MSVATRDRVDAERRVASAAVRPIGPPGLAYVASWTAVDGATEVEVDDASMTVVPVASERDLGAVSISKVGKGWELRLPPGSAVRRLALHGLAATLAGARVDLSATTFPDGHRLAVVIDGHGPPRFTVPAVPGRGVLPATFTGAGLSGSFPPTLTLPDTPAGRLRLVVVSGPVDSGFGELDTHLTSVTVVLAVPVTAAAVRGPDGSVAWSDPGPLIDGRPAQVDLRVPLRAALRAALERSPVSATFVLEAAAGSSATVTTRGPRGALVRRFPDVVRTIVPAIPTRLGLGAVPPLASERPSLVTADVRVVYDGLRLAPELSDGDTGSDGIVIGASPVLRPFPPAGPGPLPIGRVGLVGRATEETELIVSVIGAAGPGDEATIGRPGTSTVAASTRLGRIWVDLPPIDDAAWRSARPVALSVRAARGRFLWVTSAPTGRPSATVLVRDAAPRPAVLRLGGTTLMSVDADGATVSAAVLPPAAFAGTLPTLDVDLAVTVELADLTLRYER